jgi:hypothetical protein
MNVAEEFGSKSTLSVDLTPSILYALSAPSTPESVRTEVIERVEAGESVNLAEIQRLKKEAVELAQDKESLQNDLIAKTEQAESAEAKLISKQ